MSTLLEDFHKETVRTDSVDFVVYQRGDGPPLLLLHGYPQTSSAWWRVAPVLSQHFRVIIPDLPGYGESVVRETAVFDSSKRNVAKVLIELTDRLTGSAPLLVAGHDRGARVAYRMCLDSPGRVDRVALLDVMPTSETAELFDYAKSLKTYHWFFLAQPYPLPERLIENDVEYYVRHTIESWAGDVSLIGERAIAHYAASFLNRSVIHAACEDYRAGLSVDLQHDRADQAAGRMLPMPTCIVNASRYLNDVGKLDQVWSRWAKNYEIVDLDCGHFIMEEAPEATINTLLRFFRIG